MRNYRFIGDPSNALAEEVCEKWCRDFGLDPVELSKLKLDKFLALDGDSNELIFDGVVEWIGKIIENGYPCCLCTGSHREVVCKFY